jgi:hypothetical protein
MAESQNSAIPAAAMWHCHIRVWRKIPQYRPKLAMAESQKYATDNRHGQYLMTLQHMHIICIICGGGGGGDDETLFFF